MIDFFDGEDDFLSNFHEPVLVELDGLQFESTEAAFQAAKSLDMSIRRRFVLLSPGQAKSLGQRVKLRRDWEQVKDGIMLDLLRQKFQIPHLKAKLLATDPQPLLEGNCWHDNYWGDCTCPKCKSTPGKNMLGILLMQVRGELLNEDQTASQQHRPEADSAR